MTCRRCATAYDGPQCPACGLPAQAEVLGTEGPLPPQRRARRSLLARGAALATAAVVPLVAVGAYYAASSTGQEGAETPEQAVAALFLAASQGDPLALLEVVDPRESTPLLPAVRTALDRAASTDLVDDGRIAAGDLQVEGLQVKEQSRSAGSAMVMLTDGTFTTGGETTTVDDLTADAQDAGLNGVFAVTVERQGRWYVSLTRTGLEYTRQSLDLAAPTDVLAEPLTSATPEDAVREGLLASGAEAVRRLPVEHYDGVYAYLPMLEELGDPASLGLGFGLLGGAEVDRLETSREDLGGGLTRLQVESAAGSVEFFGTTTTFAFDGTCVSTTSTYEEYFGGPLGEELFTAGGEPFAGDGEAFDADGRSFGLYGDEWFGYFTEDGARFTGEGDAYSSDGTPLLSGEDLAVQDDPYGGLYDAQGEPYSGDGPAYDEDGEVVFEDGFDPYEGLFAEDGSAFTGTGPAYDDAGRLLGDYDSEYFSFFGPDGAPYTGQGPVYDEAGTLVADSYDSEYWYTYDAQGAPYTGEGQAYDEFGEPIESDGDELDKGFGFEGGTQTSEDCLDERTRDLLGGGVSVVVREVGGGWQVDPLATLGDYAETFLDALSERDVACLSGQILAGLESTDPDETSCDSPF